MADIQEPVLLTTLVDQNKLTFPVRTHTDFDVVVVTTSRNTVSLIKVRDAKPFKSWSTPQNQPFISPVVTNHATAQLVSHQSNNVIRQWALDSDSINAASKNTIPCVIFDMLNLPGKEPLVVFVNGCCHLLSKAFQAPDIDSYIIENERIIRTEAFEYEGVIHVVHHVLMESDEISAGKLVFYYLKISSNSETSFIKRSELNTGSKKLVSWSLAKDTPGVPLLILFSDGELREYSSDLDLYRVVCCFPSQAHFVSFKSLDASHIMLLANSHGCSILELWDINFKVLKKRKKMDFVLLPNTKIDSVGGGLCLVSGNQVLFCAFTTGSLSLSSSVGRFSTDTAVLKPQGYSWSSDGMVTEHDKDFESKTFPLRCKELFDTLLEQNDCRGIIDALNKSKDIPESEILRILSFFLGLKDMKLGKDYKKLHLSDNVSDEKAFCLSQVLQLPYNDVFLHHYLSQLATDKAQLLLIFLHDCLKNRLMYFKKQEWLTVTQVVNWMNMLIDAHFNFLTMTSDRNVQDFLIELNETVSESAELYEEMDDVAHLLRAIVGGIRLPLIQDKSLYRIEVLEL